MCDHDLFFYRSHINCPSYAADWIIPANIFRSLTLLLYFIEVHPQIEKKDKNEKAIIRKEENVLIGDYLYEFCVCERFAFYKIQLTYTKQTKKNLSVKYFTISPHSINCIYQYLYCFQNDVAMKYEWLKSISSFSVLLNNWFTLVIMDDVSNKGIILYQIESK